MLRPLSLLVSLTLAGSAAGQLQVAPRPLLPLPAQAVDQHSVPFPVTGLSGLTHLGGARFLAVMDQSDKLVELVVTLDADGAVASAAFGPGLTLSESYDFEAVADLGGGEVLLGSEVGPSLRRYRSADGTHLGTWVPPSVYAAMRHNRGFEAMTLTCDRQAVWYANEEALTVDGPASSPAGGTVVRLQHTLLDGPAPVHAEQYAYEVEPMHGGTLPSGGGQSGLVELVALPDGTLLALERSAALAFPVFQSRLYELDLSGATDVRALPSLVGANYTPVTKRLLWQGGAANLEGLCLGPELAGGGRALLGVIDDGDPTSLSALVPFQLTGAPADTCACAASVYCATSPNTAGTGARLVASGSTSLAAANLELRIEQGPPGQFALVFLGDARAHQPSGDGVRCVGGSLLRLAPFPLDASGAGNPPLGGGTLPAVAQVLVGDLRQFQGWYRDPAGATATFNFTDAVEVRFCP